MPSAFKRWSLHIHYRKMRITDSSTTLIDSGIAVDSERLTLGHRSFTSGMVEFTGWTGFISAAILAFAKVAGAM